MKDKIAIKIAKLIPNRVFYWCVVMACNELHQKMSHLKNRDEINLNHLTGYWYTKK